MVRNHLWTLLLLSSVLNQGDSIEYLNSESLTKVNKSLIFHSNSNVIMLTEYTSWLN